MDDGGGAHPSVSSADKPPDPYNAGNLTPPLDGPSLLRILQKPTAPTTPHNYHPINQLHVDPAVVEMGPTLSVNPSPSPVQFNSHPLLSAPPNLYFNNQGNQLQFLFALNQQQRMDFSSVRHDNGANQGYPVGINGGGVSVSDTRVVFDVMPHTHSTPLSNVNLHQAQQIFSLNHQIVDSKVIDANLAVERCDFGTNSGYPIGNTGGNREEKRNQNPINILQRGRDERRNQKPQFIPLDNNPISNHLIRNNTARHGFGTNTGYPVGINLGEREERRNQKLQGLGKWVDSRERNHGHANTRRENSIEVKEEKLIRFEKLDCAVSSSSSSKEDREKNVASDDNEDTVSERVVETKAVVTHNRISRVKDFRSDFNRGHHVSTQKMRTHRRSIQCRREIDVFAPAFISIFESLVPAEEEIAKQKKLINSLNKLINKEWPQARLHLYGSCANSFGVSNSDIDVCLSIDERETSKQEILLKLADILQAGSLQNVQALTRARVPIVKLMDPETGLSCDICINNLLAVVNTKLLRDYAKIDKRLRQLAFIVKHWARSRRVNETYQGTLSSYAYVIMCIHFLQTRRPAILPCLQAMDATYAVTVDNTECIYFDQVERLNGFGMRNKESISRLLWAFFHYWAFQHDYTSDVISIRTGSLIRKQTKDWMRRVGNDRHLICIEDPFEISHDLGRVVDKFTIKILREEFERAANILQYNPNPSVTLFEPYIPPPTPPLPTQIGEELGDAIEGLSLQDVVSK